MRKDLAKVFNQLVVSCPGFAAGWTEEQADAWAELLKDLPPDDLATAVSDWIKTQRFAPSLSQLRQGALVLGRRRASAVAERARRAELERDEARASKRAERAVSTQHGGARPRSFRLTPLGVLRMTRQELAVPELARRKALEYLRKLGGK